MSGIVFGVGTGPGDPDLLTRKAETVIGQADAIFFLQADGKPSRALTTAKHCIPAAATLCAIHMPMRTAPEPGQEAYDAAAEDINRRVACGEIVAVLCEGDPLLYGSFIHLMARLENQPEIIPGIPSFLAAASALRHGLVRRSETLALVSATLPPEELRDRLGTCDCAAILKTGRHLSKVRSALKAAGMTRAEIVIEASGTTQQVIALDDCTDAELPYFAIILAWKEPSQ